MVTRGKFNTARFSAAEFEILMYGISDRASSELLLAYLPVVRTIFDLNPTSTSLDPTILNALKRYIYSQHNCFLGQNNLPSGRGTVPCGFVAK
jgi:hypothetical protein